MYREIIEYAKKESASFVKNRRLKKIQAYVDLDDDGTYNGIVLVSKDKQETVSVPDFDSFSRVEKQANAIVETVGHIFDMTEKKHPSFVSDIVSGSTSCKSLAAISAFLTKYETDDAFRTIVQNDISDVNLKANDVISWLIDGQCVEKMEDDWNDWFLSRIQYLKSRSSKKETNDSTIISAITGTLQESIGQANAPTINGVKDTTTATAFGVNAACYVASAKEASYQSYGFKGALGCQFGQVDAELFVSGMNALLNSEANHNNDFQLLYLYDNPSVENIIGESMNDNESEILEDLFITNLLESAWSGTMPYLSEDMKQTHYHMCKFECPSRGRFFMSNEMTGTYSDLALNLYHWYRDTAINTPFGKKSIRKFYNILFSCVSNPAKKDAVQKEFGSMKAMVLQSVYEQKQIPMLLYQRAVTYAKETFVSKRSKSENKKGELQVPRNVKLIYAQIIKCYLVRKGYQIMTDVTTNVNVGYACGKLFAVYDQLQYLYKRERNDKLNKTLAQSYFSGAMQHPNTVFAIMARLENVYLNGMKKDSVRIYYTRLLGEITKEIGTVIPAKFNADEQGSFILGYYQQKAEFMKKKESDDSDNDATDTSDDDTEKEQ